jgi:hypothetical protein
MKLEDAKKLFKLQLKEAAEKLNVTEEELMGFMRKNHFKYWVFLLLTVAL